MEKIILQDIKDNYLNWIKDNTKITEVMNDHIELSSPYLDLYNENIKVYVSKENGMYHISDDGYTFWNLQTQGLTFKKNSSRYRILHQLINTKGLKIDRDSNEIYLNTTHTTLGKALHTFLQGIIQISSISLTNSTNVRNLFIEDVYQYFRKNEKDYDFFPDIDLQGKSQLTHKFDYMFTVKNRKRKLVKLINHLNINAVESILFTWEDTSTQRKQKYKEDLSMTTIINDEDKKINFSYLDAFKEYQVDYIFWSEKEQIKKKLSIH